MQTREEWEKNHNKKKKSHQYFFVGLRDLLSSAYIQDSWKKKTRNRTQNIQGRKEWKGNTNEKKKTHYSCAWFHVIISFACRDFLFDPWKEKKNHAKATLSTAASVPANLQSIYSGSFKKKDLKAQPTFFSCIPMLSRNENVKWEKKITMNRRKEPRNERKEDRLVERKDYANERMG